MTRVGGMGRMRIMRLPEPALRRVSHVHVDLGPVQTHGPTAAGLRRVIPIIGGTIDGPELRGEILNQGADWQLVQDDGTAIIDTRYTARTHDGALIYLATSGVRYATPEVLARLNAGEDVDPSEYYFRVGVRLEAAVPEYAWLNRTLFVAYAARSTDAVEYDLYAVT